MSPTVLDIEDLRIAFGEGDEAIEAVRGVTLSVRAGERLALVGESGSGKTITALSVLGLLPPSARIVGGDVYLEGESVVGLGEREWRSVRGSRVAMVYQNPLAALNPLHRIGRQIEEALAAGGSGGDGPLRGRAIELLEEVGIDDPARRARQYPHELSGGMRQRVVLACALAGDPALLIADEPTTALDVTTQARVLDLLSEVVTRRGMAVIFITHDLAIASSFCGRIAVMYAGRIVELADRDAFFGRTAHPYAAGLLGSACDVTVDPSRPLEAIPGQVPILGHYPSGCAFRPRCARAAEVCGEAPPAVLEVGEGHAVECHFPLTESRMTGARS